MSPSYKDDPRWRDIESIDELVEAWQRENYGATEFAAINYTHRYKEARALFAYIEKRSEYSERALALTKDLIDLCEGHYTVWRYRRLILSHLDIDPVNELLFIRKYAVDCPKNFQLWHHREAIIEMMLKQAEEDTNEQRLIIEGEIEDLAMALESEPKNYHAWQYRKWLIGRAKSQTDIWSRLLQAELIYTEQLLSLDAYNNSAWNYRFSIIQMLNSLTLVDWSGEVEFVWTKIIQTPDNKSVWNYLHGLCSRLGEHCSALLKAKLQTDAALQSQYNRVYQ